MSDEKFVMVGNTRVEIAPGITLGVADDEPPMAGEDLRLFLRAALGERITTGSWGETEAADE